MSKVWTLKSIPETVREEFIKLKRDKEILMLCAENISFEDMFVKYDLDIIGSIKCLPAHKSCLCNFDKTFLAIAFLFDEDDIVLKLLERSLDFDIPNCFYENVLFTAVEFNRSEIIDFISKSNANINALNSDGDTPLMISMQRDKPNHIVEKLLCNGADTSIKNAQGKTCLMELVKMFYWNIEEKIRLLLDADADPNATDNYGNTVIMIAVAINHYYTDRYINMLIEYGADPNIQNNKGDTALIKAERPCKTYDCTGILLDVNADPNIHNKRYKTALIEAVRYQNFHAVKLLVVRGTDINYIPKKGYPALTWAIKTKNMCIIECLLRAGADVNITDTTGCRPLDIAARYKKIDIAVLLIKHKADVNAETSKGKTAMKWALKKKNDDLMCYLLHHGANYP